MQAATAGITNIPIVSLAKREEGSLSPGRETVAALPAESIVAPASAARDENPSVWCGVQSAAARPRNDYPELLDIPGIGPNRRALLERFGSLAELSPRLPPSSSTTGILQQLGTGSSASSRRSDTISRDS